MISDNNQKYFQCQHEHANHPQMSHWQLAVTCQPYGNVQRDGLHNKSQFLRFPYAPLVTKIRIHAKFSALKKMRIRSTLRMRNGATTHQTFLFVYPSAWSRSNGHPSNWLNKTAKLTIDQDGRQFLLDSFGYALNTWHLFRNKSVSELNNMVPVAHRPDNFGDWPIAAESATYKRELRRNVLPQMRIAQHLAILFRRLP